MTKVTFKRGPWRGGVGGRGSENVSAAGTKPNEISATYQN